MRGPTNAETMLAYKTSKDGSSVLERAAPVPIPGAEEALVRVLRAGICNTDLEILKGYMGFQGVLGHEFVGQVSLKTVSLANEVKCIANFINICLI